MAELGHKSEPGTYTVTAARQGQATGVIRCVLGASLALGAFAFFAEMLLIA